jgi:hypothetical protein
MLHFVISRGEEHSLRRVCENRVLRGIFGSKRVEGTGGQRKVYIGEVFNCSLHQMSLGLLSQNRCNWHST